MGKLALVAAAVASLLAAGCGSSGAPAPTTTRAAARTAPTPSCSAAGLSAGLPPQTLPAPVAATRARIARAAVACDYATLERIARENPKGFTFSFGEQGSPAAYWRRLETKHLDRPLARLVKILGLPHTRNEAGFYAWPSAYTTHPTAADWNVLVRKGIYTRAQVRQMRQGGNVYYGYRTAITRDGRWQFFVAGD